MNIVLFLGAGFSAPFGLPVMNSFFEAVWRSERLDERAKKFVTGRLLAARRANAMLETSPTNLEDVLSLAVMDDRLNADRSTLFAPQIQEVVRAIYSAPATAPVASQIAFQTVASFMGVESSDNKTKLSVLTTNYDLNLELALHDMGLAASIGFDYSPSPRVAAQSTLYRTDGAGNGPQLLKLHGSVNWFLKDGQVFVEDQLALLAVRSGFVRLPVACTRDFVAPGEAIIVPPSFLKPEFVTPLDRIWSIAAAALAKASRVVFVGYSFPSSDTEMMYFLASALASNVELQRIRIIDPNADAIYARLTSSESKFGSHFKQLLRTDRRSWVEARMLDD